MWEALRTIPDNIAGPWEMDEPHPQARDKAWRSYTRSSLDNDTLATVEGKDKRWTWWIDPTDFSPIFKTLKAAKNAADKELKEEGWRLVDE